MKKSELRSCPSCGGSAVITVVQSNSYCPGSYKVNVGCSEPTCMQISFMYYPERWIKNPKRAAELIATEKWNRRA